MTVQQVFDSASAIDQLIAVDARDLKKLGAICINPSKYSREVLFSNMSEGKVSLFDDLPVFIKGAPKTNRSQVAQLLRKGFNSQMKFRTQNGPGRKRKLVTISELADKWERDRGIVSVTDLHFRHTKFEKSIECEALSDFNIYCQNKELVERLEMMTVVVSSKGNVTESHSDDSDGTNHCFIGQKLWLVWDRLEGKKAGLQDATFDDVYDVAAFSIKSFLKIPSAQWFTVEEGQTLFLPGHLTHRVITLEAYVGVGSFHVALPSYVHSLRRWLVKGSTDVTPELIGTIDREVSKRLNELKKSPESLKETYGLDYVSHSIKSLHEQETDANRKRIFEFDGARGLLEEKASSAT